MSENFLHLDVLFLVALLVLFAFLAAVIAFLVARERRRDAKLERFTNAAGEYGLRRAQRRAGTIVSHAVEEAHKISAESELEGIRALARGKVAAEHTEAHYREALEDVENNIREHLADDSARAEETRAHMVEAFEKALATHLSKTTAGLQSAIAVYTKRLDDTFRALEEEGVQRVAEAIERELVAARKSVKAYEEARVATIDTHLVDLVTRTTEIVLGKALPLEEHTRLIYRALEEARHEGFFSVEKGE
jgi:hypothetical protein